MATIRLKFLRAKTQAIKLYVYKCPSGEPPLAPLTTYTLYGEDEFALKDIMDSPGHHAVHELSLAGAAVKGMVAVRCAAELALRAATCANFCCAADLHFTAAALALRFTHSLNRYSYFCS